MFGIRKKYRIEAHSAAEDLAWCFEIRLAKTPTKGDQITVGGAVLTVVIVRAGLIGAWVAQPDPALLKKEGWVPCH